LDFCFYATTGTAFHPLSAFASTPTEHPEQQIKSLVPYRKHKSEAPKDNPGKYCPMTHHGGPYQTPPFCPITNIAATEYIYLASHLSGRIAPLLTQC
jgi:hypothetical protein